MDKDNMDIGDYLTAFVYTVLGSVLILFLIGEVIKRTLL